MNNSIKVKSKIIQIEFTIEIYKPFQNWLPKNVNVLIQSEGRYLKIRHDY